jgi:uncharacterized membrane protein
MPAPNDWPTIILPNSELLFVRPKSRSPDSNSPHAGQTGRGTSVLVAGREFLAHSHPLHARIIGAGAALLVATFGTDLIYARTLLFQWANFSIWLLTGGLVLAALAGLALVFDVILRRVERIHWVKFTGFVVAALLSLLNAFVHSRDAYTSVVPQGLVLSASVVVILLMFGWSGWSVSAQSHNH